MKKVIRITESKLNKIIVESVKRILKEEEQYEIDDTIRHEFDNFKVEEYKIDRNRNEIMLAFVFPSAGENVGGGSSHPAEYLHFGIKDNRGYLNAVTDNWYPEEIHYEIFKKACKILEKEYNVKFYPIKSREFYDLF